MTTSPLMQNTAPKAGVFSMQMLIVYHSDYGNTEKMAHSIAAGAKAANTHIKIQLKQAEHTTLADLIDADVLVFGSPVHMGSMAWQMKQLIDRAAKLWKPQELAGKLGGVFVSGGGFGNAGGGVELTMMSLHSHFLQQGMLVAGFPMDAIGYADGGLQWGAYARSANAQGMPTDISEKSLAAARSYGAHLCHLGIKLNK
ncbi:MAG: flavodoxin domain-containing protein [Mariprofundaceae bacterium]|nr:flavodoxin domain-containing protein [Mariprofundaceae bacterium]